MRSSLPDATGWNEIIYVITGSLTLDAGETQVFNSDQHYAYVNRTDRPLRFIRNVTF